MEVPKVSACTVEGAFDEGLAIATLILYRKGFLPKYQTDSEWGGVYCHLVNILSMHPDDAEFWLDKHTASR